MLTWKVLKSSDKRNQSLALLSLEAPLQPPKQSLVWVKHTLEGTRLASYIWIYALTATNKHNEPHFSPHFPSLDFARTIPSVCALQLAV